jgi:hypothetical protein
VRGEPVSIARFSSAIDAELARGRLEAEGIYATIANAVVEGRVEVQVPEEQVELALAILQAPEVQAPTSGGPTGLRSESQVDEPRCLICQSSFVEVDDWPLLLRIIRAILLQALPLPREWFESRRRRCGVCGARWTDQGEDPNKDRFAAPKLPKDPNETSRST